MMFWMWAQGIVSSRMCPRVFSGAIRLVIPFVRPPLILEFSKNKLEKVRNILFCVYVLE